MYGALCEIVKNTMKIFVSKVIFNPREWNANFVLYRQRRSPMSEAQESTNVVMDSRLAYATA